MSNPSTTERRRRSCPLCAAPVSPAHAPFCGQGCRDRDLLNWLGEGYAVPGPAAEPPPGDREG